MKPTAHFSTLWVRVLLALLLVVAIGCIWNADGAFLRWSTHRDMLRQVSGYGLLACGMTLVVISGGIDLAVVNALKILHGETVPKEVTLASRVFTPANIAPGGEPLK